MIKSRDSSRLQTDNPLEPLPFIPKKSIFIAPTIHMPTKPVSIILIGYRATGKTSVGKALAASLHLSFIDVDQYIEQREACCITDMVKEHGWPYFREKEKSSLLELTGKENHVIATGGGAILHQDIWPTVKERGLVIWLKADTDTICKRLAADSVSDSQRPSLTGTGIQQEVADVLVERTPLYDKSCHLSLDATESVEDIVQQIHDYLNQH